MQKKYNVYIEKKGEYTIVRFITEAQVDIEATKRESGLDPAEITREVLQRLIAANPVYAKVGDEAIQTNDEEAAPLKAKLDAIGEHQILLLSGEYEVDYSDVEYWIPRDGVWTKEQVTEIGTHLPEGAVLPKDLTQEQQQEIAEQAEEIRICCMTPEERTEALQRELDALADEAARLEKRAQIQRKTFDPVSWYAERETAINAKYAMTA